MTRHRPILDASGALANRHGVNNLAVGRSLLRVGTRAAHAARSPQMLKQLCAVTAGRTGAPSGQNSGGEQLSAHGRREARMIRACFDELT